MLGPMKQSTPRAARPGWALGAAACLGAALSACAGPRGTLGAVLAQRNDGTLVIREAPPALAAAKAGLVAGDEILLIEGKDVRAMTAREVHQALAGDVGEVVRLTVTRGERALRVTATRTAAVRRTAPLASAND